MQVKRPITNIDAFNAALSKAALDDAQIRMIEYIRYMGTFNQPQLVKDLNIKSKPPALSILCTACRMIGSFMPNHFTAVRQWSQSISMDNVRWDGHLICCSSFNVDGEMLIPECKTAQYHNFAVHKELFIGLD